MCLALCKLSRHILTVNSEVLLICCNSDIESYIREDNPSVRQPCRKNYYSTRVANLDCEQCPIGYTTPGKGAVSADACVLCPAGMETFPGGKGCDKCQFGEFKPTAAPGFCLRCPPGFSNKEGRKVKCTSCPVGFFERFSQCTRCTDGMTTAKRGATECRRLD